MIQIARMANPISNNKELHRLTLFYVRLYLLIEVSEDCNLLHQNLCLLVTNQRIFQDIYSNFTESYLTFCMLAYVNFMSIHMERGQSGA